MRHECFRHLVAYSCIYYILIIIVFVFSCPWVSSSCVTSGWTIRGKVRNLNIKSRKLKKAVQSRGRCHNMCTPHICTQSYCSVLSTTVAAAFADLYIRLYFEASLACSWELGGNARSRRECRNWRLRLKSLLSLK